MVDFFKPVRASVQGRRSKRPGLGVVVGGFVFKVTPSRLQWPAGAGRLQSLGTPVSNLRKVWDFLFLMDCIKPHQVRPVHGL